MSNFSLDPQPLNLEELVAAAKESAAKELLARQDRQDFETAIWKALDEQRNLIFDLAEAVGMQRRGYTNSWEEKSPKL